MAICGGNLTSLPHYAVTLVLVRHLGARNHTQKPPIHQDLPSVLQPGSYRGAVSDAPGMTARRHCITSSGCAGGVGHALRAARDDCARSPALRLSATWIDKLPWKRLRSTGRAYQMSAWHLDPRIAREVLTAAIEMQRPLSIAWSYCLSAMEQFQSG